MPDNWGEVRQSVTIDQPADALYAIWRRFERFPEILTHIKSVKILDDVKSHWEVEGPADSTVSWDAVIVRDVPGQEIAWETTQEADVMSEGQVRFVKAPGDQGTEIHVALRYKPPGGVIGRIVAGIFHRNPNAEIANDLRRFKQVMELGRAATITGQPAARDKEDKN